MITMERENAVLAPPAVTLPMTQQRYETEYGELVHQFEEAAAQLLERVDDVIDEVCEENDRILDPDWREDVLFLAGHLMRLPWLLVNVACPPQYETLKLLYAPWAESCEGLGFYLRRLAGDDPDHCILMRIGFVEQELAAVNAHTTARTIYLAHLAA